MTREQEAFVDGVVIGIFYEMAREYGIERLTAAASRAAVEAMATHELDMSEEAMYSLVAERLGMVVVKSIQTDFPDTMIGASTTDHIKRAIDDFKKKMAGH